MEQAIEKLYAIINQIENSERGRILSDLEQIDAWIERTARILDRCGINSTQYRTQFLTSMNKSFEAGVFSIKKDILVNIIQLAIDEIELAVPSESITATKILPDLPPSQKILTTPASKIFIVHGHNEIMKQTVARFVEKIKFEPIILHEQHNLGQTVIEKFVKNAAVGFAIVLLSADDFGYGVNEAPFNIKKRARQNVVFELGYFTALLGRDKVFALVENMSEFELPSDFAGVAYTEFDKPDGKWRIELIRELRGCGHSVDANQIL